MADWVTISSLATAGGTMVLAVATFASVRSANRSARITELALQEQLRPVLVQSNLDDPVQKIGFSDQHWVKVHGGGAAVDEEGGNLYLVLSVRNVGTGIAVLQAWHPWPEVQYGNPDHVPVEDFRPLTRDLYIPAGGTGLWQGAIRDTSDPAHAPVSAASAGREPIAVDILYSDHMGGQRTISRFALIPAADGWIGTVSRHWNLDRIGPRGRDE
jgi:hypothetical protein